MKNLRVARGMEAAHTHVIMKSDLASLLRVYRCARVWPFNCFTRRRRGREAHGSVSMKNVVIPIQFFLSTFPFAFAKFRAQSNGSYLTYRAVDCVDVRRKEKWIFESAVLSMHTHNSPACCVPCPTLGAHTFATTTDRQTTTAVAATAATATAAGNILD